MNYDLTYVILLCIVITHSNEAHILHRTTNNSDLTNQHNLQLITSLLNMRRMSSRLDSLTITRQRLQVEIL